MESTSSPDHGRQSRGLARFWPVHGTPAPGQRQSDDAAPEETGAGSPEAGGSADGSSVDGSSVDGSSVDGAPAAADAGPVAGSAPTGEPPQVDAVRPGMRAG
jgi:hypothetical protein